MHTLSAGGTELVLRLARSANGCQVRADTMRAAGVTIDLSASPLWQLDLRHRSALLTADANTAVWVPGTTLLQGGTVPTLPCADVAFESCASDRCEVVWRNIAVELQVVTVRARIRVRPDGMVEWDANAQLTPGDLLVHVLRYPVLLSPGMGTSPLDDVLVLPWNGGHLAKGVLGRANGLTRPCEGPLWLGANDTSQDDASAAWVYGNKGVPMQFVAHLDSDARDAAGLYLAAEDSRGNRKQVYANRGAASGVLADYVVMTVSHFNAIGHTGATLSASDQVGLDVGQRLGYRVVTKPFTGDWMTAASLYRNFVANDAVITGTGWLRRGKLKDLPERKAVVTPLMIMYLAAGFTTQDADNLLRTVDFYRQGHTPDLPLVIMPWTGTKAFAIPAFDSCYTPNAASEMSEARRLYQAVGTPIMFNHDTGKIMLRSPATGGVDYNASPWCATPASDPLTWLTNADIAGGGVEANIDGSPYLQNPDGPNYAAASPWWIAQRSIGFAKRRFVESASGANFGLQLAMLSGTLPVPTSCWAPLDPRADLTRHDHPLGGGSHHYDATRAGYQALEDFAAGTTGDNTHPIADFGLMLERGSELYLDHVVATHNETVRTPVFVGVEPAGASLVIGSGPAQLSVQDAKIPLFDAVYRDFSRRGNTGIFPASVATTYGGDGHLQFQYVVAQLMAQAGQIASLVVAPAAAHSGVPADETGAWLASFQFVRELADVAYAGRKFTVYSRLARPPALSTDVLTLDAAQEVPGCPAGHINQAIPAVLAGAFVHEAGSVGYLLANWTDLAHNVTVTVAPEPPLSDGTALCMFEFTGAHGAQGALTAGQATFSLSLPPRSARLVYAVPGSNTCSGF